MSDSSSSSSESPGTLYDPPDSPTASDTDSPEEGDTVPLRLSLPKQRAERLRTIAQQLGLTPSLAAKRAIELVCNEVVTIQDAAQSSRMSIDEYQARLDLLHSVEASSENGTLESPDD